jgi:hypothetical protein
MILKKINTAILLSLVVFAISSDKAFALSIQLAQEQQGQPPIKTRLEVRQKNMDDRKEVRGELRNEIMGDKGELRKEIRDMRASTSVEVKGIRAELKDMRKNFDEDRKEMREDRKENMGNLKMPIMLRRASSTDMFKRMNNEGKDLIKKMKKDDFESRKKALLNQLNISLENLSAIKTRINDRILKAELEGRNVTDAKSALAIADDKLAKAKTAVEALSTLQAPSPSSGTASSTEVDLTKPRQVGDSAIKAVKEARDAYKKVIDIIAKSMGLGDKPASSTPATN